MMVKNHQFAIGSLSFGLPIAAILAVLAFVCAGAAQTASVNRVDQVDQAHQVNQLVEHVMQNESRADTNDHSHWVYRDQKRTPEANTVKIIVETAAGDIAKTIEMGGRALTAQERQQDDKDMEELVNSRDRQEKARQASERDDQQAHAFMQVLPVAFIWTEASRIDSTATLNFKPNPQFQPPSRELRVLGAMSGEMVVDLKEERLISLSGHLTAPVDFGWGLLGKLQKGGTFHIERREIAPGEWQTTETHVHIKGKALFFKSISEQEDEETSGYKPAPPSLSLSEAARDAQERRHSARTLMRLATQLKPITYAQTGDDHMTR